MHELLDEILEADSQRQAQQRLEQNAQDLKEEAPAALQVLEDGLFDATSVLALPEKYRRRLRTSNMLERLIQEVRRREKVIRIFPNKTSAWRLVGALLAEKHEEGRAGRRYLTMDAISRWTSSTNGAGSKPSNQLMSRNQNPPIVLFNLPDRQRALHNRTIRPMSSQAEVMDSYLGLTS